MNSSGEWKILDLIIVSVIALIGRVGYWIFQGTKVGRDTSTYTATCDVWLSAPWLIPRPQNAGFTLPFCFVTEVLNLPWSVWVAFQIILSVGSCCLIYIIALQNLDRIAGIGAGISMAVLWDSFQWNIYILTDALFVVFVTVALWAISRREQTKNRKIFMIAWIALLVVLITRPYGLPVVLGWLAYDFFPRNNRYRFNLIPHPLIGIGFVILGFLFVVSQYPDLLTDRIFEYWASGQLVYNDPMFTYEYNHITDPSLLEFILFNLPQIILISSLRVILFFVPVLPRWSNFHNIVNLVTLAPILLASFAAIVDMLRHNRQLLRQWIMPLVMILLVVSVTFVDWDWRYRAPAAPVFSLLTGYAVWRIWHAIIVPRVDRVPLIGDK